ncbi:hypothetical protein K466DRAFT_442947, partial [Polyporus arcularius HHB13444]
HQWLGTLVMMKRILAGIRVSLMDDISISKTIQILMVIALIKIYCHHYEEHKHFPGMFANIELDTPDGNLPDLPHIIAIPSGLCAQWEGEIKHFLRWGLFNLISY